MRLVYYSLANFPDDSRERQWVQSIRSLRLYNRTIPVWLLLFNGASDEMLREAEQQSVQVCTLGDYEEFLRRAHPRGSVLSLYPTFHKFLSLENLPLQDLTQLLYLDCDTFFFGDVNRLFDLHAESDWYAREEPGSLRSQFGSNPKHVDEMLLQSIARSEKLCPIPPFNSGVCLLNHGIWRGLIGLGGVYLGLAWRLLCGRELGGHDYELHDPRIRPAVMDGMTDADRSNALPYPSANDWIIEQIALWLALGHLPQFSLGTLSSEHVPQGGEFEFALAPGHRCILAHYFSGAEREFFSAVAPIGG